MAPEATRRFPHAGAAPTGHAWVAMEFIDGKPWSGPIVLFAKIYSAVQRTLNNLVVHRDIRGGPPTIAADI